LLAKFDSVTQDYIAAFWKANYQIIIAGKYLKRTYRINGGKISF
jgi:hypothetical protein